MAIEVEPEQRGAGRDAVKTVDVVQQRKGHDLEELAVDQAVEWVLSLDALLALLPGRIILFFLPI